MALRSRLIRVEESSVAEVKEDLVEPEFWDEYWGDLTSAERARIQWKLVSHSKKAQTVFVHAWVPFEETSSAFLEWALCDNPPARVVPVPSILAELCDQPKVLLFFGNNGSAMIFAFKGGFTHVPVTLDELDYVLLSELDSIEDVQGDLWAEVAVRLGAQIRKAIRSIEELHGKFGNSIEVAATLASPAQLISLFEAEVGELYLRPMKAVPKSLILASGKMSPKALQARARRSGTNLFALGQSLRSFQRAHRAKRIAAGMGVTALVALGVWFFYLVPLEKNIALQLAEIDRLTSQKDVFAAALEEAREPAPRVEKVVANARPLNDSEWSSVEDLFFLNGLVDRIVVSDGRVVLSRPDQTDEFWQGLRDASEELKFVAAASAVRDGLRLRLDP